MVREAKGEDAREIRKKEQGVSNKDVGITFFSLPSALLLAGIQDDSSPSFLA